jgi:hypothetical protein
VEVYLDVEADVTPKTFRPASVRIAWWYLGRWLAVFDAILVVALVLQLLQGQTKDFEFTAVAAFPFLLVLFLLVVVAPRSRRNKAFIAGHMHFVAREDGYVVEGPFGTQTIRWETYKKAYVDKRFIYMFVGNLVAQVIPLRLVADPEPLLNHLRELKLLRRTPRTFILF